MYIVSRGIKASISNRLPRSPNQYIIQFSFFPQSGHSSHKVAVFFLSSSNRLFYFDIRIFHGFFVLSPQVTRNHAKKALYNCLWGACHSISAVIIQFYHVYSAVLFSAHTSLPTQLETSVQWLSKWQPPQDIENWNKVTTLEQKIISDCCAARIGAIKTSNKVDQKCFFRHSFWLCRAALFSRSFGRNEKL